MTDRKPTASTRPCTECKHLDPKNTDGAEAFCRSHEDYVVPTSAEPCPDFAPTVPPSPAPAPDLAEIERRLRWLAVVAERAGAGASWTEDALASLLSYLSALAGRTEEREEGFYCGCEHHRPGSNARALWDEDGCCQVCGVDVDPWTIRALAAESSLARLRERIAGLAAEFRNRATMTAALRRVSKERLLNKCAADLAALSPSTPETKDEP